MSETGSSKASTIGLGAGAALGRYRLLFRLAAGGMAEVYVARQKGERGFRKLVAIKRMLPHLGTDERFVEMFLDEARIVADVASPNVVPTLDLGVDDEEAPFIVMELVIGVSLWQLIRDAIKQERLLPPGPVIELLAQAADGLYDAHQAKSPNGELLGIVHRDVSPQNILVGADGRARITDFGVARALNKLSHTNTGEVKGKFSYFSPEQANARELDGRSDVFALGIVAFETLARRRLFKTDSPLATLEAVRQKPVPRLDELDLGLPTPIADVVARALERNVEARYASAAEFSKALRAAASEAGLVSHTSDVAELVQDLSKERVDTLRVRIEEALAADEEGARLTTESLPPAALDGAGPERSGVARRAPGAAADASEPAASEAPPVIAAPAPRRGVTPALIGGLAILAIAAAAFAIAFSFGTTPATTPAVSDAPAPAVVPPPEPTLEVAAPATPAPTETAPAAPPEVEVAEVDEANDPEEAAASPDTPRSVGATRTRLRIRPPETTEAAPVEAPPPAGRRGPLRGMDAFERDLTPR